MYIYATYNTMYNMIYTYQFLDYSDLPLAHLLAHRPGLVEAMVQSGSNSLDLDLRYGCW